MIFGVSTAQPREEYCLSIANSLAGMRLSYYFVQNNFDDQRQVAAVDMIERIEAAYLSSVSQLHWMDNSTRAAATEKLNAITNMVGHPELWPDWEAPPNGSTLFEYYSNAAVQADAENRADIGQAVDRTQWYMIPTQVNAYYSNNFNQIVFPAGILQAPFFDSEQPAAVNYGGLGSVIGHELGHSLDDSGSQYTANGTLENWWSDASRARFENATQCVSDLYSSYEVQSGLYIDGDLVLGESIADLGGLRQSYAALEQWRVDNTVEASAQELDILNAYHVSSSQLFFISFAQAWCEKATPQYQVMLTETNAHPVSRFRVRGALSNSAEFASTFSCPSGSTYNPIQRCRVW
jgi:predicted metalloendopeptidase